jgi:protein TonB
MAQKNPKQHKLKRLHPSVRKNSELNISRFFACSFAVHIILIAAVVMLSNKETLKRQGDLLVSLVSPDKLFSKPQAAPRQDIHYGQSPPPAGAIVRKQIPVEKGIIRDDLSPKTGTPKESVEDRPKESSGVPATPPPAITKKAEEPPSKPAIRTPSMREKLFDRTIIGDLAKKKTWLGREKLFDSTIIENIAGSETERGKEMKKAGITFYSKEERAVSYFEHQANKILQALKYPLEAQLKNIHGDLIIFLVIKKNGQIGTLELDRTSGHIILDEAAMKSIKDAEPFWPLMDEWEIDSLPIIIHYLFLPVEHISNETQFPPFYNRAK